MFDGDNGGGAHQRYLMFSAQQHYAQAIAGAQGIDIVAHVANGDELEERGQGYAFDRAQQDLPAQSDDEHREEIHQSSDKQKRLVHFAETAPELLGMQAAKGKVEEAGADDHAGDKAETSLVQ